MAEKKENNTYEMKLNHNYYVVTANDLIKGRQKMSLREAQLLYIAMAQVVKEDTDFKTYTTTVPELLNLWELIRIAFTGIWRTFAQAFCSVLSRYR